MNFTTLEYFLAVAEDGNITKAADKLHISQQSLSCHMSRLEKELNVVLFERTPSFHLTYAGERFKEHAQSILNTRDQIIRESSDIADGERCRLSIGISYTCGRAILPRVLPGFCQKHPLVEINLMEGNSSELEYWFSHDELDFMIAFEPIHVMGAETHILSSEELLLAVPVETVRSVLGDPDGEEVTRNRIMVDIRKFHDIPFIMLKHGNLSRSMFDDYLLHEQFEPKVLLETENSETALALSAAGMGVTFFSRLFLDYIHPALKESEDSSLLFFPLNTPETTSRLIIARKSRQYQTKVSEDFLKHCVNVMQNRIQ